MNIKIRLFLSLCSLPIHRFTHLFIHSNVHIYFRDSSSKIIRTLDFNFSCSSSFHSERKSIFLSGFFFISTNARDFLCEQLWIALKCAAHIKCGEEYSHKKKRKLNAVFHSQNNKHAPDPTDCHRVKWRDFLVSSNRRNVLKITHPETGPANFQSLAHTCTLKMPRASE